MEKGMEAYIDATNKANKTKVKKAYAREMKEKPMEGTQRAREMKAEPMEHKPSSGVPPTQPNEEESDMPAKLSTLASATAEKQRFSAEEPKTATENGHGMDEYISLSRQAQKSKNK